MFIVYITRGSYSDYSVDDTVLVGEIDPFPILDCVTKEQSGGQWNTFEEQCAYRDDCYTLDQQYDLAAAKRYRDLRNRCKEAYLPALRAAGFTESQAREVWVELDK